MAYNGGASTDINANIAQDYGTNKNTQAPYNKKLKIETKNSSICYTFYSFSDEVLATYPSVEPLYSIDVESLYNNYNKGLDIEFSYKSTRGLCTYIIPYNSITQISLQIVTDLSKYYHIEQGQ